jgi:S1-C subfamily serine protease
VLISATTYYKVSFEGKGPNVLYFSSLANEGFNRAFPTAQQAIDNAGTSYGTGFFIDPNGKIATNLHVVANCGEMLSDINFKEIVTNSILDQRDDVIKYLSFNIDELRRIHPHDSAYLYQVVPEKFRNDPPFRYSYLRTEDEDTSLMAVHKRIDSLLQLNNQMEGAGVSNFTIELEVADLNISLDASTGNQNTYDCDIVTLSQDKTVDLAIIQTKDKSLPEGVKNEIDLSENDLEEYGSTTLPWDTVKVTTPLYLIGYNYGPEIAKTSSGIQVQLTRGQVTQESDKLRVLYSIPALPGSSGSPVFNKQGKVVAVHYCGVVEGDNFNYGILSSHLKQLLDAKSTTTLPL